MLRTRDWALILQKRFPAADSYEYPFKELQAFLFWPETPGFPGSWEPFGRKKSLFNPGVIPTIRKRGASRLIFFGHIAAVRLHSVPWYGLKKVIDHAQN